MQRFLSLGMKLVTCLLCTFVLGSALPVKALVMEDSFYDVEGLKVRAKAASEVSAKAIALRSAKERAFKAMIARFLTRHDFKRLQQPKLRAIEDMIRDIQLEEERYGGGIYIAVLNIRFRLENVRKYLQDIGFAYSETVAGPHLLLPVFVNQRTKSVFMWESENIWLTNWLTQSDDDDDQGRDLLPIYLPKNRSNDRLLLPDIKLVNQNTKILDAIKGYYHTDNVILVTASGNYQPETNVLSGLEVVAHFLSKEWKREPMIMKMPKTLDATQLLSTMRKKIFAEIQDQWKKYTAIQVGDENQLVTQVKIVSLQEWLKIKKMLEGVPDIISFRLQEMGTQDAVVALKFYGTKQRLEKSLAREFLNLTYNDENKHWVLQATHKLKVN